MARLEGLGVNGAGSLLCVAFITLSSFPAAHAVELKNATTTSLPPSAVVIDEDDRLSPEDYARANSLSAKAIAARFGATGLVRCGQAVGTGQLVGASNVVVTAAHVLFAPGGHSRGEGAACTFEIDAGGRRQVVELKLDTVQSGCKEPYAEPAIRDWAVAALAAPVVGVRPYTLAAAMNVPADIVLTSAARSGGVENHSLERCKAREVTGTSPAGLREVAIDCDAEGGTSGAAMLTDTGGFLGVYVGFRSAHPGKAGPFSMSHYNFGLTAEGTMRQAIMEVVSRNQPLSASR